MSDDSQEIFDYLVKNDPSGNQKYLMWMVKMYDTDSGFSPNMLQDYVQRFHTNLDKIHPALVMDMGFYSGSKVATSPKNIDSYPDYRTLKRIVDAAEESVTRKQTEKKAKSGVDKLYEDDRWLLVKPNTHEGSCYYGSATKWCTSAKDAKHFNDYSKTGNLFYIIDKSKDVGDFFKIALHKKWTGEEEWYDRGDNQVEEETVEAIRSLLPVGLIKMMELEHSATAEASAEESAKPLSLTEFKQELDNYVDSLPNSITLSTETGKWKLETSVPGVARDVWLWIGPDPRIELITKIFSDGEPGIQMFVRTDDDDLGQPAIEYNKWIALEELHTEWLGPNGEYQMNYLNRDGTGWDNEKRVNFFIRDLYMPLISEALNDEEIKEYTGQDYKTWDATSYVTSYTFKYPPKEGTMTQRFTDYIKENPRRTPNQFYEDVLGRPRPRGHNNMFFAAIKDSGIVKMERKGRQFVYSLGPNYEAWTQGKLLRKGRAYGKSG